MIISQDAEGLRAAALELMEEGFEAPERERAERIAGRSEDPQRVRAATDSRTLPVGYYMWLNYVVRFIAEPLEAGVSFSADSLYADELMTLMILREARAKFRRLHPACSGCGKLLPNEWDKTCNDCQRAAAARARGN